MGFFKNLIADRNSGKLEMDIQRRKDLENNISRDKSEQKRIDKTCYRIGVEKSRAERYKQIKITNKIDNSTHNNHFDTKVETTINKPKTTNIASNNANQRVYRSNSKNKSKK